MFEQEWEDDTHLHHWNSSLTPRLEHTRSSLQAASSSLVLSCTRAIIKVFLFCFCSCSSEWQQRRAKMTSKVMSWIPASYFLSVCLSSVRSQDALKKIDLSGCWRNVFLFFLFFTGVIGVRINSPGDRRGHHCPEHSAFHNMPSCQIPALYLRTCLCYSFWMKKKEPIFSCTPPCTIQLLVVPNE